MNENVESLENLRENLREHGLSLNLLPWVIQYNKRDLPDVYTVEELEEVLNPDHVPHYQAVARSGQGVADTFKGVSRLLLQKVARDVGVSVVPTAAASPSGPDSAAAAGAEHEATKAPVGAPAAPPAPSVVPAPVPQPAAQAPDDSETRRTEAAVLQTRTVGEKPGSFDAESAPSAEAKGEPDAPPEGITAASDSTTRPEDGDELRPVTVGERLRRWLSRPGGRADQSMPDDEQPGMSDPSAGESTVASSIQPSEPARASEETRPPDETPASAPSPMPEPPRAWDGPPPPEPAGVPEPAGIPEPEPRTGSEFAGRVEEPAFSTPLSPTSASSSPSPVQSFPEAVAAFAAPSADASSVTRSAGGQPEAAPLGDDAPVAPAAGEPLRISPASPRIHPAGAIAPAGRPHRRSAPGAKPREVIVPLILDDRDLSRGVIVRFAIQFASGEEEGDLEESEAA
jgi:hypothetical protein